MATRTVTSRPTTTPRATTRPRQVREYGSLAPVAVRPTLAQRVRQLLPLIALATVVVEAMLAYRIWVQVSGSIPATAPGSWVYGLAGSLVAPFRGYDSTVMTREAPVLDFAALIALEAYLVVGVVAGLTAFGLSHAPLLARIRPWSWRIDLSPVGRAAGSVASGVEAALAVASPVARRWWVQADGALEALTQRGVAYLQSRDWAGYKARAATYRTRATEGFTRARTVAATRSQEIIASRDWSRERQRIVEARQAALERSRVVAQRLQPYYRRSASDARRLASYASPRAGRLLIDTGRALYVRGPQSATWLSSQAGEASKRGGASVVEMLSTRPVAGSHGGPTVSRRDFLRLTTHHPEPR